MARPAWSHPRGEGQSSLKGAGLSSGSPGRRTGPFASASGGWKGWVPASRRAPTTIRGQGGAPAAKRGRTTLTTVRSGAYCARETSPLLRPSVAAPWSWRTQCGSPPELESNLEVGSPVLGCQSSLRRGRAAWSDPAAASWTRIKAASGRPCACSSAVTATARRPLTAGHLQPFPLWPDGTACSLLRSLFATVRQLDRCGPNGIRQPRAPEER
jgi:hypothetical protein